MLIRTSSSLAVLALATLTAACSGAAADDVGSSEDAVVLANTSYAFALESRVNARDRSTGATFTEVTKVLGRVVIVSQETQPDGSTTTTFDLHQCRVQLPKMGDFQPMIEDAFVQSLPPVRYTGTIDANGVMTAGPQAAVIGATLADPLSDALPTDASDARIVDQDGDGKPGVTIKIDTGLLGVKDIYAASRLRGDVTGAVAPGGDGNLTGTSQLELEFSIFGDNIPLVDAAEIARELEANKEVLSKDTRFLGVPGADSCDAAIAADPVVQF